MDALPTSFYVVLICVVGAPFIFFALVFGIYWVGRRINPDFGRPSGAYRNARRPGGGPSGINVFPPVNTNGQPMIPGTNIDVTGRPFGS